MSRRTAKRRLVRLLASGYDLERAMESLALAPATKKLGADQALQSIRDGGDADAIASRCPTIVSGSTLAVLRAGDQCGSHSAAARAFEAHGDGGMWVLRRVGVTMLYPILLLLGISTVVSSVDRDGPPPMQALEQGVAIPARHDIPAAIADTSKPNVILQGVRIAAVGLTVLGLLLVCLYGSLANARFSRSPRRWAEAVVLRLPGIGRVYADAVRVAIAGAAAELAAADADPHVAVTTAPLLAGSPTARNEDVGNGLLGGPVSAGLRPSAEETASALTAVSSTLLPRLQGGLDRLRAVLRAGAVVSIAVLVIQYARGWGA